MRSSSSAPLVIEEAGPQTRVLLVHAPYPGRLKFDGQPSSLMSAAASLVSDLDSEDRLNEVGWLDPGFPSEDFYQTLEHVAGGGELRVACISTSTAAIGEAARIARVLRELAGESLLIVGGGPQEDDCELPMAERLPEIDVSIGGDGEDVLCSIAMEYLRCEKSRWKFLEEVHSLLKTHLFTGGGSVSVKGQLPWNWKSEKAASADSIIRRPWTSRTVRFPVFADRETLPLMVSRGCSYGRCTFCAEADGLGQRVASDLDPLFHLIEAHPEAALYFQDSIFPSTRFAREQLLPFLKESQRSWGCQVYLPTLSREFARLLVENGCTYIYTGVESGSEELRVATGKRGLCDSLVRERLKWIGTSGASVGLSLMFGILDAHANLLESEHSVEATIAFAHQCLADGLLVEGFYPNVMTVLPGTPVALGLAKAGVKLDFYSMPRVPEFSELEDGEVGYNFASVPGLKGVGEVLIEAVREAAAHLSGLWLPASSGK